jgi:hypothetical protein
MKKRFTEEQIIKILKEHEGGKRAVDIVREHGISEQTFYLRIPAYPDGYSGNIRTAFRRIRTLGQAIIIVC